MNNAKGKILLPDGTEVTKPKTIDQLNLYWFNTYKVKD